MTHLCKNHIVGGHPTISITIVVRISAIVGGDDYSDVDEDTPLYLVLSLARLWSSEQHLCGK